MFCANCGNEVDGAARFCSRCGQSILASPGIRRPVQRDWDMHVNVLGWLLVGSGVLTGGGGLMIVFTGHLFSRWSMFAPGMPFGIRMLVGSVSALAGLCIIALGAGIAGAGVGLL